MPDNDFSRLVSLACHDLRTPLATIYGFARTLNRIEERDERSARFLVMIEEAAEQMTEMLDALGAAARIEGDRWEPVLREVDTAELPVDCDESGRVTVEGTGEVVATEVEAVSRALGAFASAALRHGPVDRVAWRVNGRELELAPVTDAAAPVVSGEAVRDLGSVVGRRVIERLGGSVAVAEGVLHIRL
jgi:signal transduction histidine kinase